MTCRERLLVVVVLAAWLVGSIAVLVFQPQPFARWLVPAAFTETGVE